MHASNREPDLTTSSSSAKGDFVLNLVFSAITTAMLALAIDAFAGGLNPGALVAVVATIELPLAALARALNP